MARFNEGDLVILIDDETPEAYRQRTGKKFRKIKNNKQKKMGFLDTIDKISDGKIATKKYKFKAKENGEDDESNPSLPTRKMYRILEEWFQLPPGLVLPNGFVVDIDSIDLDERFIENIVIPYNKTLE